MGSVSALHMQRVQYNLLLTSSQVCRSMQHTYTRTHGFVYVAGQQQQTSGYTVDIESGKEKFLAAHHSPAERDYVAKYGQKAYRTASGVQVGVMPQPLTPGHTATVKIKALTEQEAAAPGRVVGVRCCSPLKSA